MLKLKDVFDRQKSGERRIGDSAEYTLYMNVINSYFILQAVKLRNSVDVLFFAAGSVSREYLGSKNGKRLERPKMLVKHNKRVAAQLTATM